MRDWLKKNLLFFVVVGAAMLAILVFGGGYFPGVALSSQVAPFSDSVEGEILAVDNVSASNRPAGKEARVKLASGKEVRAYVPPGCAVFPGEIASLTPLGSSGYIVKSSREKK